MPADANAPQVLGRWLTRRPSAPLITYYGSNGARVELSAASAANAVNKAVNLFEHELLLDPGATIWLAMPCHWQAPVLAIAAWAAGLTVAVGPQPPSGTAATAATGQPAAAGIALAVPLHPWGLPLGRATPPGWEDFASLVRIQPDSATPRWPAADQPWLVGVEVLYETDVVERAGALAESWGLPQSGRLLSSLAPDTAAGLLACTMVPALLGAAVILSGAADTGEISRQERNDASARLV